MDQTSKIEVVLQRLTPLQMKVAALLLQGSTVKGAAEANGLHRTTVHTWCRTNPAFQSALQEARRFQAQQLADEAQCIAGEALDHLRKTLNDDKISPTVRLRAALAIIDRATQKAEPTAEQARVMNAILSALRQSVLQADAGGTVLRVGL